MDAECLFSLQLYQAVTGQNSNAANALNVSIIMCGVAKMFAGELVEEGDFKASNHRSILYSCIP